MDECKRSSKELNQNRGNVKFKVSRVGTKKDLVARLGAAPARR